MPNKDLSAKLTKVNQDFDGIFNKNSVLCAEDKESQTKYKKLQSKYEEIVKSAKNSNPYNFNYQSKLIELSARLKVIHCKLYSFNLSLTSESISQGNDSKLKLLKNELDKVDEENGILQKKSCLQENKTFGTLNKAKNNWEKDARNIQVAYYYNFACHILETTRSPQLVKKSIRYLEKASALYAQDNRHKAKKETDIKIAEAKKNIKTVTVKALSCSLGKNKIQKSKSKHFERNASEPYHL